MRFRMRQVENRVDSFQTPLHFRVYGAVRDLLPFQAIQIPKNPLRNVSLALFYPARIYLRSAALLW
jgi:hypothetical protein